VCQEVCPFNASGPTEVSSSTRTGDAALAPRPGYSHPPLLYLLGLGAAQFRKWQAKSALRRIHRAELLRNVAVALGNVGGAESLDGLEAALREPSPLVRAHAVWAIAAIGRRHGLPRAAQILAAHATGERDPEVLAELAA
jgi:epoxyqueuosine reductase